MITLFTLGKKGLNLISNLEGNLKSCITLIIIGKDPNIINDYSLEIKALCDKKKLDFVNDNNITKFNTPYAIAIGWRKLISYKNNQKLIVFHDSILPRLRGFNPLVTALINGDKEIGVTALFGSSEYDRGNIIGVKSSTISYPMKIKDAIEIISVCYSNLGIDLITKLFHGEELKGIAQNDNEATYSLWRDEKDYIINWHDDADKISRHIDAVGFPYNGAKTKFENETLTILDSIPLKDVIIENRQVGKVIFKLDDYPVIVCGKGLLKITRAIRENGEEIKLNKKFRMRFT